MGRYPLKGASNKHAISSIASSEYATSDAAGMAASPMRGASTGGRVKQNMVRKRLVWAEKMGGAGVRATDSHWKGERV